MKVDADLVKNVAALAQLNINDSHMKQTMDNLNDVLALVEEMQTVDTEGVAPLANPLDATQKLRRDEVTEQNQREQFQKISPSVERGFFLVPRVVE